MNKKRLMEIADIIKNQSLVAMSFNMSSWRLERECDTMACIAGWTCVKYAPKRYRQVPMDDVMRLARDCLNLTKEQARDLFVPKFPGLDRYSFKYYRRITPKQAADTIRKFVETGEIVWTLPV